MSWYAYVQSVAPGDPQKTLAAAAGVDGSTVSRWKNGFAPKPENVAAFARAYGRPVLEAFMAAGFLTAEEAAVRPVASPGLKRFSTGQIFRELGFRLAEEGLIDGPGFSRDYEYNQEESFDADDPANYDLAAHPPMETEHEKYERLHGDRGEENQDPRGE